MRSLLRQAKTKTDSERKIDTSSTKEPEATSSRKRWICEEINAVHDTFAGTNTLIFTSIRI